MLMNGCSETKLPETFSLVQPEMAPACETTNYVKNEAHEHGKVCVAGVIGE